jgi:hypothetical protein
VFGVDDGKLSLVVRSPLRAAARARAMNQLVAPPPSFARALAC